ncbi:MAG: hypothetical protein H8F28_17830 [Fibrella sp.]|nr:hypothetical protein [Armatimonadota bacterium]
MCALAGAVQTQNPIKDGHLYYYTGAATITTSLLDVEGSQLVGNDVIIGRSPSGIFGAPDDINLGTSLLDSYTVTIAAGAETPGNNDFEDGSRGGVSVFNFNRLLVGTVASPITFMRSMSTPSTTAG